MTVQRNVNLVSMFLNKHAKFHVVLMSAGCWDSGKPFVIGMEFERHLPCRQGGSNEETPVTYMGSV